MSIAIHSSEECCSYKLTHIKAVFVSIFAKHYYSSCSLKMWLLPQGTKTNPLHWYEIAKKKLLNKCKIWGAQVGTLGPDNSQRRPWTSLKNGLRILQTISRLSQVAQLPKRRKFMLELKRGGRTRFSDGDGRIYTCISPCSSRPQIKTTARERETFAHFTL